MLDKVPPGLLVLMGTGILLAGPITVATFLFGGPTAAAMVLVIMFLLVVTLYLYIVRKYT